MADTEVVWGSLTVGGGGPYHVEEIIGWDDLTDVKSLDEPRTRGRGDHPGEDNPAARIVTVRGSIATRAARDELARALMASTPNSTGALKDLTIETFGRQLRAGAKLIGRSLPVGDDYPSGKVPFALRWKCTDPYRYGPVTTLHTGLPTAGGGMSYPITYPTDYGPLGATGQIVLNNEGDQDAPLFLEVLGELPEGFEVSGFVSAGVAGRIRYPVIVPSGQRIHIDNDEGSVLAEGTADRRGELTAADWMTVPAASPDGIPGSLTLQFSSLGGVFDPAADLLARWSPTYS